ncbi:MAG TPA: translation initiation factor IF-2 [Methylomirabilota bacterium]|nr:translation initiation factor IF-2 [Methylomirabilota bacterium]
MMELAKELGVTSKELMVAAEEMGHKGVRAMSPLESTLANALRLKLGKGRELPEEPKPKRVAKPKVPKEAAAATDGAPAKTRTVRGKATVEVLPEETPVEVKPAATIVKSKPAAAATEIAPEPPLVVKRELEIAPEPPPIAPVAEPQAPVRPAAAAALAPAAPSVKKPEPKIVPFRPLERAAPAPPSRPSRQPAGPFAPPRVSTGPPRPAAPPAPARREPPAAAAAAARSAAAATAVEAPPEPPAEVKRELIRVPESVTVGELAEKMRRKSGEVIKALLELGVMATLNELLDPTAAKLVADKFNVDVEIRSVEGEVLDEEDSDPAQLKLRPPVVTVMGHVDHGKTSLLDAIRKSRVAEKEFGGITQHIGAYQVETRHGRVTFLDTPGHEAFTAMRARGAQATDIVILVVAADDGVMPQTVEAINHARAANVPILVAVNKMDKPEADLERVKRELANHALVPEDWGGQTIYVPTSAKKGTGIDQLLEMTALQSEILELKANPTRAAKGVIIESRLDRGRGPVATVLIQNGTLKEGDAVVVGAHSGRIRSLIDPNGKKVKSAGPSDAVEIQGLSGVPSAGDVLVAVSDERKARQIATMRQDREKAKGKASTRITLEGLQKQIQTGEVKELRLILKADVQGSVEALAEALERLSTDEVKLKVIHGSVGAINESDVMLASASNAVVIGFNVKPEPKAATQAQANGVDVRTYNVIYEAINEMKAALAGMLAPEIRETALGKAQVRQIFVISKLGPICGSYVAEGKVTRGAKMRVRRGDEVVGTGTVGSLKRFKDDVREVLAGLECGIGVDGVSGIQPGDILEAYTVEEVARTL